MTSSTRELSRVEVSQSDIAAIMYSSWATGEVKGVMLTHRNLIAAVASYYVQRVEERDSAPVLFLKSVAVSETVVVMERFDLRKMMRAVEEFRVTNAVAAPPMVVAMAKEDVAEGYDLRSLEGVGCGGSPLAEEVIAAFKAKFPFMRLLQGYGLTESTGTAFRAVTPKECERWGSVGRLLGNCQAKIVDPHTGIALPPCNRGELWIRGPMVMKGYVGNKEATSATLLANGWLRTGDLCYIDNKGFLFIVDRLKELIKCKGYQVPPTKLEQLLQSHPDIVDAAVVPYPDEEVGQVPMAFVCGLRIHLQFGLRVHLRVRAVCSTLHQCGLCVHLQYGLRVHLRVRAVCSTLHQCGLCVHLQYGLRVHLRVRAVCSTLHQCGLCVHLQYGLRVHLRVRAVCSTLHQCGLCVQLQYGLRVHLRVRTVCSTLHQCGLCVHLQYGLRVHLRVRAMCSTLHQCGLCVHLQYRLRVHLRVRAVCSTLHQCGLCVHLQYGLRVHLRVKAVCSTLHQCGLCVHLQYGLRVHLRVRAVCSTLHQCGLCVHLQCGLRVHLRVRAVCSALHQCGLCVHLQYGLRVHLRVRAVCSTLNQCGLRVHLQFGLCVQKIYGSFEAGATRRIAQVSYLLRVRRDES
ncbi:hypothetical protein ACSBR2_029307 [Camellia fascicularis]